jgi:hypothetical protein
MFPSLVSVEVAAKSFVFPRWSNFIFFRPHKLFRRAILAGCFHFARGPASSVHNDPHSMDVAPGHDLSRCDSRGPTDTSVRIYTVSFWIATCTDAI